MRLKRSCSGSVRTTGDSSLWSTSAGWRRSWSRTERLSGSCSNTGYVYRRCLPSNRQRCRLQKKTTQDAEVLFEDRVLYFDDHRKWKKRYVVVRANYCLECHDSLETFVKGIHVSQKLLPTGGTVLTSEADYMAMVDKCFPDNTYVKEDFSPPVSGMPGQFPVYLRLPYRRDSYFCFHQEPKRAAFVSILTDCIRHQNHDFLKKKTCEVQAFLKAIQFYREDKGQYEAWNMLIGSDVRVMANLVLEQLLPSLQKDMLPHLKAKKTEKKRVWFATVEAAYILVQERLLEGLTALKEECRRSARQEEVLIRTDMDQILSTRQQLEEKIHAVISEPAQKFYSENIQPYLSSILEELMQPISSGFQQGGQLSESMMDQACQDVLQRTHEEARKTLVDMARPNLSSCYQEIASLQEKLPQLQERFGFSNVTGLIHSAQIDLQKLMESAAFTYEQLLYKAIKDNPHLPQAAIEKAKHRVLKQYDYDSSSVRKRIFHEGLLSITLPYMKKNLDPTCKTELKALEQFVNAEYANFINVENVYESILVKLLDNEVTKVVKEAASLRMFDLMTDSRELVSQSSVSSPSASTPGSPAVVQVFPIQSFADESQQLSPQEVDGVSPLKMSGVQGVEDGGRMLQSETPVIVTPLVQVEENEMSRRAIEEAAMSFVEGETRAATSGDITSAETAVKEAATCIPKAEVGGTEEVETQSAEAPKEAQVALSGAATAVESLDIRTNAEEPKPDPTNEEGIATTTLVNEEETLCKSTDVNAQATSGVKMPILTPTDNVLHLKAQSTTGSIPSSLNVSVGSDSPLSDLESCDNLSMTSDLMGEEVNTSRSPDDPSDDQAIQALSGASLPEAPTEAARGCDACGGVEPESSVNVDAADTPNSAAAEEAPSSPSQPQPVDCIQEVQDLV
ncbi:protein Niban 1a isoform X3 [Thalassophryne amazonica]|nr:protein Niban 1a isoform X3 [Thalassophryne amazonica]